VARLLRAPPGVVTPRRRAGRAVGVALAFLLVACGAAPARTATDARPTAARPPPSATVAVASPTPRPAAPPTPVVRAAPSGATVPGRVIIVRDERRLAVIEAGQERVVYAAPAGGLVKDPAFSPDGRRVAFASAPPGRPAQRHRAPGRLGGQHR
jgi:hypothetical protein